MIFTNILNTFKKKDKKSEIVKSNFGGILFKEWMKNGLLHREDGPAVINSEGDQEWYINGKRHREDGPAIIAFNGKKQEWWINDHQLTSEQFEKFKLYGELNLNLNDKKQNTKRVKI
jgi:hypothetical protein